MLLKAKKEHGFLPVLKERGFYREDSMNNQKAVKKFLFLSCGYLLIIGCIATTDLPPTDAEDTVKIQDHILCKRLTVMDADGKEAVDIQKGFIVMISPGKSQLAITPNTLLIDAKNGNQLAVTSEKIALLDSKETPDKKVVFQINRDDKTGEVVVWIRQGDELAQYTISNINP